MRWRRTAPPSRQWRVSLLCRWHRRGGADVREAGGGARQGAGIVGRLGGGGAPLTDVNRAAELVGPWERAARRVSDRSHGGGGGVNDSNDCDPTAAVHVLVAVVQITAMRMPAAMLDAVGAGGVACSEDGRLAAIATPADRRRGLTATTTAALAPNTPLAVAAATPLLSSAVPPSTQRFASAAFASTAVAAAVDPPPTSASEWERTATPRLVLWPLLLPGRCRRSPASPSRPATIESTRGG